MKPRTGPAGPIQRAIRRVDGFFNHDIWRSDADELGFPLAPLYRVLRVVQLAIRGIILNRALFTASALTYTTVLSLVPLLAFAFSVAKGMGAYDRLRNQVIEPFLDTNLGAVGSGTPEAIRTLRDAIERILELVTGTDVSSLGVFGLAILIFVVIRVLSNVEDSFNRIWGVRRARTPVRRVADYLSLAVITPLLLVVAVGLTAGAQNSDAVEVMRQRPAIAVALDGLFGLTPLLSIWLGFSLLYMLLPNTTIQPKAALLGGIMGGSMWQLAQIGHVKFQMGIANYNAIYSSFAAFPIFLVWIYVSWVTVMFGAEFAHALQDSRHHRQLKLLDLRQPRRREALALRALVRIVDHFDRGEAPWTPSQLAEALAVPATPLAKTLQPLVDRGLLVESASPRGMAWMPGRDPATMRLSNVLDALRGEVGESLGAEAVDIAVETAYERFREAGSESRYDQDLLELARASHKSDG